MSKKILVGYQKGGVGKTTVAANLAYYLQSINPNNKDNQVLMVDGDKNQITLTSWFTKRQENPKAKYKLELIKLNQYAFYNKKFNYEIFDITGELDVWFSSLDSENHELQIEFDTLLVPVSLSSVDLEPLKRMFELLVSYPKKEKPLKVFIFINKNPDTQGIIEKNEIVRSNILQLINQFKTFNTESVEIELLVNSIRNLRTIEDEIDEGLASLELSSVRNSYRDFERLTHELQIKGAF